MEARERERGQNEGRNRRGKESTDTPNRREDLAKKNSVNHCNISESSLFPLVERHAAAAAAKSLQSCPTLCDPIDGSPPGSPVPGILQARTLGWVAISFSNA